MNVYEQLYAAKRAKKAIGIADTEAKNSALLAMAESLEASIDNILASNTVDIERAQGVISEVMQDRLRLTTSRIRSMAEGIRQVAALPDPCMRRLATIVRPNGLEINKVSSPMGVIAIIFESRPNVTSDAAALAIKAGSACILRAGKEAHESASAIVNALKKGVEKAGLPADAIQLIEDTSRESANILMTARGYVDLLIPRGGKGLIRACVDNASVPVLETGTGICHIYVDVDADQSKALDILENAKCSRPSVCNAVEQLIVHKAIAADFLPKVKQRLVDDRVSQSVQPVELRLDRIAKTLISGTPAVDSDFSTEFLDYVLAVSVVDNVTEAVTQISENSSGHSEAIITENADTANSFVQGVDSAAVYVNASTRFTDGGEFGLGCEMGISTQKLHARGPLGLEELCTFKYVIAGNGQIRV